MKKFLAATAILVLANCGLSAGGFQASLTPDIAIIPKDDTAAFALNIWGQNEIQGASIGFVNGMVGDSYGFNWALFGAAYGENFTGVLWGSFFARTTGDFVGWQAAMININEGKFVGFQSGLVNFSNYFEGLQLGLVNWAKDAYGVQIGLVNVVESNAWFTDFPQDLAMGFPFVNWSF